MKTARPSRKLRPGFVSYVLVLSAGLILTLLMVNAYHRAASAQAVQGETQLRMDYAEKEDAVLRAIVNITPNRAILAMKSGSSASSAASNPLRWQQIFSDAIDQANARTSITADMKTKTGAATGITANAGDSALASLSDMFDAIEPDPGYVSPGVNKSQGVGFPVPLETSTAVADLDRVYPIISSNSGATATNKTYGTLASSGVSLPVATYYNLNVIPYPEIRFGYSTPGQPFVAKRNWWAFSMQLAENDQVLRSTMRGDGSLNERDFILSIYEIPSQLAISAETFTNLGSHADGSAWQNTTIQGGIYSTRAQVDNGLHLDRLSGRRGLSLGSGVTVGDKALGGDPFAAGIRETFEVANGSFMPVTMASESGRAAFYPINRRTDFFDRFSDANKTAETQTLSPTTWNNYSSGAMQCAMRLDVTAVTSTTNPTPTEYKFSYLTGGAPGTRVTTPLTIPLTYSGATALQTGYTYVGAENTNSPNYTTPVDVAYGANGKFYYKLGMTGVIPFTNATFQDPLVGTTKGGWVRPACPFENKLLHGTKRSIAVYPERIPAFVTALGGSIPDINNSLVVNVAYGTGPLVPDATYAPHIPCTDNDYGVLMTECANLTKFKTGFSLVTNLRLYIGDDFNTVATTVPVGSGLPSPFYPPASLFAPEKRYGTDIDPFVVKLKGQVGHLGGDTGVGGAQVHVLDLKMGSESNAAADKIEVNLRPITHPAELPPITMMNWLIMIEERHKAFYTANGTQ